MNQILRTPFFRGFTDCFFSTVTLNYESVTISISFISFTVPKTQCFSPNAFVVLFFVHLISPWDGSLNGIEVLFEIITNFFCYSCKIIRALTINLNHFLHITNLPASMSSYFNSTIFLVHKIKRTICKAAITVRLLLLQ